MAFLRRLQTISKSVFSHTSKSRIRTNENLSRKLKFSTTRLLCEKKERKEVSITFIKDDGERLVLKGKVGNSLLDVVENSEIELQGYGICGGSLNCGTCQLIFAKKDYDSLLETPSDEELDVMDLYRCTETSRTGCQVIVKEEMNGLEVKVPLLITAEE